MSQFIIENPFLSILISYIIGAVVMNIILAIAIHREVVKEVGRAMGEHGQVNIVCQGSQLDPPPAPIVHDRVMPIWLGKDEDGQAYIYFEEPTKYDGGTGPYGEDIPNVYYECESKAHVWLDELRSSNNPTITYLKNELESMAYLKYGVLKINLYDDDVVRFINAIFIDENE